MPYSNLPKSQWSKMERCVKDVMAQGHDKKSAIAICYTSIRGGAGSAKKELEFNMDTVLNDGVTVTKEDSGRYKITAVSTAAVADREGETFDTGAMDYEIKMAETTGEYPEFRMFHKKALAIGQVTKMRRVGIFAIDEGYSYDDAFSKEVCQKMLTDNPGKWKVSRGFYVMEASGGCPKCGSNLLIKSKEMAIGFMCPTCKSVHPGYKGVLKELHFRKTKTFDVTVTDIPCVPFTGVAATKDSISKEFEIMDKKDLKAKLLSAGLSEDVVDSKLSTITDAQLKEYSDIPEAEVLKEFEEDMELDDTVTDEEIADANTFTLDESVLKQFTSIVTDAVNEAVKGMMDGLTVEVENDNVSLKEQPEFVELQTAVNEIKTMLQALTKGDADKVAEVVKEMPRNGELRVIRMKAAKKVEMPMMEPDDDEADTVFTSKKKLTKEDGVVVDSDGNTYKSMSQFIGGGSK